MSSSRPRRAIALRLLKQALAPDIPRGFMLADAAYGSDTAFHEAVTALGVWAPAKRLNGHNALVKCRADWVWVLRSR
jgi:hypothetical protein